MRKAIDGLILITQDKSRLVEGEALSQFLLAGRRLPDLRILGIMYHTKYISKERLVN